MLRTALPLVLLVCLSLLGAQFSGLHMHVDHDGYSGAPHAAHSHDGGADPHDHGHDTDVMATDQGTIGSKQLFFLVAVALAIVMIFSVCRRLTPRLAAAFPPGRRLRWRPPLRAPPIALYPTH